MGRGGKGGEHREGTGREGTPNILLHLQFQFSRNMPGWLNHKVVTHPAISVAQDRGSSPVETSILTTMLRRQIIRYWRYFCGWRRLGDSP